MINISHVGLDPWYDFENNADIRIESNIFCDASTQTYIAVGISFFRKKFKNKIYATSFYPNHVYPF